MLPNGDLAIGCSDNRIWVFTRESSRFASADLQAVRPSLRLRVQPDLGRNLTD